jgi:hypothetical protein
MHASFLPAAAKRFVNHSFAIQANMGDFHIKSVQQNLAPYAWACV